MTNRKILVANLFYISNTKTRFYTLLCMQIKVTIEERKQLETTWVTPYKATVVLRWYVSGLKVMVVSIVILNVEKHKTFKAVVFIVRQTLVLPYFLFATSIPRTTVLYFRLPFLNTFYCWQMPCLAQAPTQPHCSYQLSTDRRSCWNNMACHKRSIDIYIVSTYKLCCGYL